MYTIYFLAFHSFVVSHIERRERIRRARATHVPCVRFALCSLHMGYAYGATNEWNAGEKDCLRFFSIHLMHKRQMSARTHF